MPKEPPTQGTSYVDVAPQGSIGPSFQDPYQQNAHDHLYPPSIAYHQQFTPPGPPESLGGTTAKTRYLLPTPPLGPLAQPRELPTEPPPIQGTYWADQNPQHVFPPSFRENFPWVFQPPITDHQQSAQPGPPVIPGANTAGFGYILTKYPPGQQQHACAPQRPHPGLVSFRLDTEQAQIPKRLIRKRKTKGSGFNFTTEDGRSLTKEEMNKYRRRYKNEHQNKRRREQRLEAREKAKAKAEAKGKEV